MNDHIDMMFEIASGYIRLLENNCRNLTRENDMMKDEIKALNARITELAVREWE